MTHLIELNYMYKCIKNYRKNFHDILERGWEIGVKTKHHLAFFHEQIELQVVPKH